MSLSMTSLSSIPTCYATVSIGTPNHDLQQKLKAIAAAGFEGIELGFPDLLSFASKQHQKDVQPQDFDTLCATGMQVRSLCDEVGLKIVMLQPFANFEGWKPQSEERRDAFRRAEGWIRIMEAVGTDMLQVSTEIHIAKRRRPQMTGDLGGFHRFAKRFRLLRGTFHRLERIGGSACTTQFPSGLRELVLGNTRSGLERCVEDRTER